MEKKIIRKYFSLADFLEEQDFLQEQHKSGWKFVELKGINKYIFEKTEAEDFVYQLDVIPDKNDEKAYLQMFREYGWEYITRYNSWYYFRKTRKSADEDMGIFSDADSKLDMIKRSWNIQMASSVSLSILSFYWLFFLRSNVIDSIFPIILGSLFLLLCVAGVTLAIRNYKKFERLKNSIENPMGGGRE